MPSYYAISYTWGDPADTAEITVNGKPLAVRRNCEYVLQQAFATKACRYYWVDAICIAQMSTQERNHQVGIMGKIYSGAKHVFACVGPHEEDSEYLMAKIEHHRSIFDAVRRWGQSTRSYDTFYVSGYPYLGNPINDHMCRQLRSLFTVRTSERLRMSKAFVSFIRRPYFTRVWVLQELHLATGMSYCCGADVQPGESFRALDALVEYWVSPLYIYPYWTLYRYQRWLSQRSSFSSKRSKDLWRPIQLALKKTGSSRVCLRLGVSAQKQDLDDVLAMLRGFRCVDARDYLYGILSLVRWPDGHGPSPDYTKDNFEVAKQALSLWPRDHTCYAFRSNCRRLFQLFGVTPTLQSLQDAIALRSSVAPEADHRQLENRTSEFATVSTMWRGIQISDVSLIRKYIGDRRQPEPVSCYMERERNGRFVWLRGSSTVSVCAPVDTRMGDWCLVANGHFTQPFICGLILRKSKDDEYTVVGPALAKCWNHELDHPLANNSSLVKSFIGWSDPEDLLVLAWTLDQFADKEEVFDEDIEEFLGMRVCGWEDSSYFEPAL